MEEFPDVQQKLSAPKKLSAFEKERQAAALKQQKAEEENAAALRAFEDSFADGEGNEDRPSPGSQGAPPSGPRGAFGGNRGGRFAEPIPSGPRSGPGSLGPVPSQRSGPGSLDRMPMAPQAPPAKPVIPFGAEIPREERQRYSMRNAPPPGQFAPPGSYGAPVRPPHGRDAEPDAIVSVRTPLSITEINAIHMVADFLLQKRDAMEALRAEAFLMRIPAVRNDENMAFLYDSSSQAGIYYRWLLWGPEDIDEAAREARRKARDPERLFSDVPIDWMPPNHLPFPDLKSLAEAVTDIDYESSEEESEDEDGEQRQFNRGPRGDIDPLDSGEQRYLTPLKRARLVYLLSRLPTSIARLRKGDVARVTNFAIKNAGAGAEEIVDTLLLNVAKPFCYFLSAKYESESDQGEEDDYEPNEDLGNLDLPVSVSNGPEAAKKDDDGSNAKLIGIYIISDILSASSTAGVRNAWRYRQLFEAGFKAQKTFAHLGRLEKELSWGRIKAEQWKRKIEVVLGTWEGWSVFGSDVMDELRGQFFGEKKEGSERPGEFESKAETEMRDESEVKQAGDTNGGSAPPEEDIEGVPMSDDDSS